MPALDFKEIPEAHKGSGEQDTFEQFCSDFFQGLGYQVTTPPGRGADGGKDMILTEVRKGISGTTQIRWLVSCKHKAHSGASVGVNDEQIKDSMEAYKCTGFIGFYSTLASSALIEKVERMANIDSQFFSSENIEKELLKNNLFLAKRYFPVSFKIWSEENPESAKVLINDDPFSCHSCGKELGKDNLKFINLPEEKVEIDGLVVSRVEDGGFGIVHTWHKEVETEAREVTKIRNVYVCCNGYCSRTLVKHYHTDDYLLSWVKLDQYFSPALYLKQCVSFCNRLNDPKFEFSKEAFNQQKALLIKSFPYVARKPTAIESSNDDDELAIIFPELSPIFDFKTDFSTTKDLDSSG